MSELLRFETVVHDEALVLPMLVDIESVSVESPPDAVVIDGEICDIDEAILRRLVFVIDRMTNEALPEGHFQDCVSFTMAMCGLWMPTHKPFERRYKCDIEHDDTIVDQAVLRGPVSTGIPYNERFLGFEGQKFIYGHAAYIVETSWGLLALHRLSMKPEYAFSTIGGLLSAYQDEVVHPINKLTVVHMGEETFRWERSSSGVLVS